MRKLRTRAARRPAPQEGDVLASRPTARADCFAISVVPAVTHAVARCYDEAIATITKLAREHAVDAWYTCNHTHFLRVAHHRLRKSLSQDKARVPPMSRGWLREHELDCGKHGQT